MFRLSFCRRVENRFGQRLMSFGEQLVQRGANGNKARITDSVLQAEMDKAAASLDALVGTGKISEGVSAIKGHVSGSVNQGVAAVAKEPIAETVSPVTDTIRVISQRTLKNGSVETQFVNKDNELVTKVEKWEQTLFEEVNNGKEIVQTIYSDIPGQPKLINYLDLNRNAISRQTFSFNLPGYDSRGNRIFYYTLPNGERISFKVTGKTKGKHDHYLTKFEELEAKDGIDNFIRYDESCRLWGGIKAGNLSPHNFMYKKQTNMGEMRIFATEKGSRKFVIRTPHCKNVERIMGDGNGNVIYMMRNGDKYNVKVANHGETLICRLAPNGDEVQLAETEAKEISQKISQELQLEEIKSSLYYDYYI